MVRVLWGSTVRGYLLMQHGRSHAYRLVVRGTVIEVAWRVSSMVRG